MIQLEGNIQLGVNEAGATDYSGEITSLRNIRTRNVVTKPATFANAREEEGAGALKEMLEINFLNALTASSLWAELYDAIDTDTGELYWEGTLTSAAVGADNPKFSGTIVVTAVHTGGDVGARLQQRQQYPIVGGITKAIV
jgi:hypothetical protein